MFDVCGGKKTEKGEGRKEREKTSVTVSEIAACDRF